MCVFSVSTAHAPAQCITIADRARARVKRGCRFTHQRSQWLQNSVSTRIARATVSLAALASAPLPRAPQAAALHTVSQGLGLPPAAPPPAHNLRTSHHEACTPQTPRMHGFNGLYFVTPSWHCVKLDGRGDTHSAATMILCDRPQTLHALPSR
jgi:hypothetical protein